MIWLSAVIDTFVLIVLTSIISLSIGSITALFAWLSNRSWAYFLPILMLAVPPWLLTFYLADTFGYIDPWLGASLSLGIACSVYPHSVISSSLANRAYKDWEMMQLVQGKNLNSLIKSVWPSFRLAVLPSVAIIAAEVVADFGVANYYGLNTVTMLTYNIWTSTWNFELLLWGIIILAGLGLIISRLETQNILALTSSGSTHSSNWFGIVASMPTLAVLGFGIYKSISWILIQDAFVSKYLLEEFLNSMLLVFTVIAVCFIVLTVYLANIAKPFIKRTGLGMYALPGTVIGATYLYLLGSYIPLIVLLIVAIATRYFGLMIHSVVVADKGNEKYFEVVDFYTVSWYNKIYRKIKIVLPSIAIGASLIVLDVLRELPISMLLQPYNFQTLAMRMNYIAMTEDIPSLGPQSLIILFLGLVFSTLIIWITNVNSKTAQVQNT